MKHYINKQTNEIYAYASDGSQDAYIKPELIAISDAELAALLAPTAEQLKANQTADILAQIAQIEVAQVRPTRELLLDQSNAYAKNKLATLDAQIVALRAQLVP